MNWHRMADAVHGTEGICGSGGKGEKRKMFSHREHGFPTVAAEAEDKDWLRLETIIWRITCVGFNLKIKQRALSASNCCRSARAFLRHEHLPIR